MLPVRFPNNTRPDEVHLSWLVQSVVGMIRDRLLDSTQPGIRAGLQVTVDPSDATRIVVAPGWGYTPSGERVWLKSALTGVPLSGVSTQGIPTETWRIPINANGSYVDGEINYVLLRFVPHDEHPSERRDEPHTIEYLIVTGRFELEVLSASDYVSLVANQDYDASALERQDDGTYALPTLAPFASRSFRVVLASVRARGPGQPILSTDIVSGDPGVSQPVDLTGVRVVSVSPGTPRGTGMLRWTAAARTLSWQAPTDNAPGLAVEIGQDNVIVRLESSSSVGGSVSVEVEVIPSTLPSGDVEEPVGLVPRLQQSFPQADTPRTVTGVSAKWVTTNTQLGDGTLSFSSGALTWRAPGDTLAGEPVDVTAGGEFTLRSETPAYALRIFVSETALPGIDASEALRIRGLYEQDFPIQTAIDLLHRSMIGDGIPNSGNPHGSTWSNIADASGENIFETHQDRFHINGISVDADPAFLSVVVNPDDTLAVATLDGDSKNKFLVAGRTYSQTRNVPELAFSPAGGSPLPTGYYLIAIDSAAVLTQRRVCDVPDLTDIAVWAGFPDEPPPFQIVQARRTTTSGNYGRIRWNRNRNWFRYRGPGNADFGPQVLAAPEMTLVDSGGDWIRVRIDLARLLSEGGVGNIDRDFRFWATADDLDDQGLLSIAMVLWDSDNEQFALTTDLRRFATADVTERFEVVERDLRIAADFESSIQDRLVRDDREQHDCGISTRYAHGSLPDDDPNALLVERFGTNAQVVMRQPVSSWTWFRVRGKRYQYVAGRLISIGSIPLVPQGEQPPNPGDLFLDFASEASDNGATPEFVASLFQVYIDDSGRLGTHVRVRMQQDVMSKPVSAIAISDISADFPIVTATLRCRMNVPTAGFLSVSIGIDGTFGPEVVVERNSQTSRLHSADGIHWVDVTNAFGAALPLGDASEQFTVLDPISTDDHLEIARVCYDGSAEILRMVDKRRFGSIGRRCLGDDALSFSRSIRDGLHADTHFAGVISGLNLTWQDDTLRWSAGVVVVDGLRIEVPQGSYQNTLTGPVRIYMSVEPDGAVVPAVGSQMTQWGRSSAQFSIIYIGGGGTSILYVEDRRFPPASMGRRDFPRRIQQVAGENNQFVRSGLLASSPFSAVFAEDEPTGQDPVRRSSAEMLNCHMTFDPRQGVLFFLDDEEKDGLIMMAIQNMDPARLPSAPSMASGSNFAFFRVPAGANPRLPSDLVFLGSPGMGIAVRQGSLTVYPTNTIDIGAHLTLSQPTPGNALIDADTQGGGGGGGGGGMDVRQFGAYTGAFAGAGAPANGSFIGAIAIASFSAPSSGYKMNVEIGTTVDAGGGGDRSPVIYVMFDNAIMRVNGDEEVAESVPRGSEGAAVHFSLGNISVGSGSHTIGLALYGRNGSTIAFDGRIHIAGFIAKAL